MLLVDHFTSQDEVLDKYKMVYDQGLDRVKFPSDITQEAGSEGSKLELISVANTANLQNNSSSRLAYFIDLL